VQLAVQRRVHRARHRIVDGGIVAQDAVQQVLLLRQMD